MHRFCSAIQSACPAFALTSVLSLTAFAGELAFKKHTIDATTDYSAAALIDVNHDGQLDIVCGSHWYQGPDWKRHFVANIPRINGRPDGFAHLPFDVNRDGWTDVITVNYRSRTIKWMEHPGADLGVWQEHVAVEPGAMETGRLVDIDGDGALDLLPNGAKFAAWWEFRWNPETTNGEPAWIRHELPPQAGGHGIGFGDINGDRRGDIVGQHGWLEAPSDARNGQWKWHADFEIERGSTPMLVVDPDEDGDNDIVWTSAHGFGVYWLEQSQSPAGQRIWTRHAIDTSWSQCHSPLWVDLDGDGRNELVAGKRYMAHGGKDPGAYDPMGVFRYQYDAVHQSWSRRVISAPGQRVGMGLDPKAGDIDGDGDLDLLASGRSGLYWLENLGHTAAPPSKTMSTAQGSSVGIDAQDLDSRETWGLARSRKLDALSRLLGKPHQRQRVPLAIERVPSQASHESTDRNPAKQGFKREGIRYRIDSKQTVAAELFVPTKPNRRSRGAIVTFIDHDTEVAANFAKHMAQRGFVVLSHTNSQSKSNSLSERIWQAIRAGDVLQAQSGVNAERLAFVSDSLNGDLALAVAALDQRFVATLTATELPRETNANQQFANLPRDFLLAAIAPRAISISAPRIARPQWKATLAEAAQVFTLTKRGQNLQTTDKWLDSAQRKWLEQRLQK